MNTYKHTWHHIRRSPIQSLTAIAVMTLSFFILAAFFIISNGMSSVLKYFETKPEVTIFLKDGLDKLTIDNVQKELSDYPSVKEIRFISKEKALDIYKQQNKDNPLLTEMVTASILPASFEVSVSDPKALEQISQNFSVKTNVVDEIIYQKDIIQSILSWTNFIRRAGIIAVASAGLISFFIISVIIAMKITSRKDEIKVSRLLGASKQYVIKPFVLEGIFYGFVGSFLGCCISFLLTFYFSKGINQFFQPVIFVSSSPLFYLIVLTGSLFIGSFVGYLASSLGVKRYIKF